MNTTIGDYVMHPYNWQAFDEPASVAVPLHELEKIEKLLLCAGAVPVYQEYLKAYHSVAPAKAAQSMTTAQLKAIKKVLLGIEYPPHLHDARNHVMQFINATLQKSWK